MSGICGAVCFVVSLFIAMVVVVCFLLKSMEGISDTGKHILGHFVQDNSVPDLTDLVRYHKVSDRKIKYNIKRD